MNDVFNLKEEKERQACLELATKVFEGTYTIGTNSDNVTKMADTFLRYIKEGFMTAPPRNP